MSAISNLVGQHRHCDQTYATLEAGLRARKWDEAARASAAFSQEVLSHLKLEEEVLFPAFEDATGMTGGPTRVMRMEHEDMRDLLEQLRDAVEKQDGEAALSVGETLLVLTQQHNVKEENILYPMCEQHVPDLAERLSRAGL